MTRAMYQRAVDSPSPNSKPSLAPSDFRPVARGGVNDPANGYPHSMVWYRNCLFIGVTRHPLHAPRFLTKPPINVWEVYPVDVPKIHWELDWRTRIWRFDPARAEWRCVFLAPWCMGSRGFEVARMTGIRVMTTFQGPSDENPALYAGAWGSRMGPGPFLLRSTDGENFSEIPLLHESLKKQTIRALLSFRGMLFAVASGIASAQGTEQVGSVYVTKDPLQENWELANVAGFGDPRNESVVTICAFNGYLYAGTFNTYEGFEIWKTTAEGPPPFQWNRVLSKGAYRGNLNQSAGTMCAFKDHLYVGTMIIGGGFDPFHMIGPAAAEVLRISRDDSWELLVGDPRHTPEGFITPLSGMMPGFNNMFSGYLWQMCEHEGALYAATMTWASFLRYSNRELWPARLKEVFSPRLIDTMIETIGGFGLWSTQNGVQWSPVTMNGFGNSYNVGGRTMASTPHGLFVGTVNQFSLGTAVRRLAGWRYEHLNRCGLEIWLGSSLPIEQKISIAPSPPIPPWHQPKLTTEDPLLDEFYGNTAWRNVGFWAPHVRTPSEACENLMDELMAFALPDVTPDIPIFPTEDEVRAWLEEKGIQASRARADQPPDQRSQMDILDVYCGYGATTRHLSKNYMEDGIIGLCRGGREARIANRLHPQLNFQSARGSRLKFRTGSFDLVFFVEGPACYARTANLLPECFRVLRPGGRFIFADGVRVNTTEEGVCSQSAYEDSLSAQGFESIRVIEVANRSLEPFRTRLSSFLREKELLGSRKDIPKKVRRPTFFLNEDSASAAYWIGCATRPTAT